MLPMNLSVVLADLVLFLATEVEYEQHDDDDDANDDDDGGDGDGTLFALPFFSLSFLIY